MFNQTLDIITICFNSASTIAKTIESVRRNRSSISSYIIIDGGSTDGTVDIVNHNRDIVDIFISEKDDGISDAFNKGIKLSTADYILLLNSDDFIYEDALVEIQNNHLLEADLVCTTMMMWNGVNRFDYYVSDPAKLKRFTSIYHPGLFVKRTAYQEYGLYNKKYKVGMDYEFISRCVVSGATIKVLKSSIVVYSELGTSRKNFWRSLREGYVVRRVHHKLFFPGYEMIKVSLYLCRIMIDFLCLRSATTRIRYHLARWLF
jgi:glycosyltransferase involved in cell wall biosynthesis